MAVAEFTITELRRIGAVGNEAETGEVFRWTSDRTPPADARGGARAAPLRPWSFGQALRTKRTDYPGAKTPSEQVLGPHHKPFTLGGRFDDRYNFPGYAVGEMRRFEAMVRRGNLVRVQFQNQAFECLIKDVDFDYHREWYIRYSFTVSTHARVGDFKIDDRSPPTTPSAQERFDRVDQMVVATLQTNDTVKPASFLSSEIGITLDERVAELAATRNALGDSLDQREFNVNHETVSPFRRLATLFRDVRNQAADVSTRLLDARSDLDLAGASAITVLDFEDWTRTLRHRSRAVLWESMTAAIDIEERDDPRAIALYRPSKNESLYNVSRRFYGTPFAWRLIAERNALSDILLTGEELLIIPERGEG